ncbi:MAG: TonB family protein [Opitutaceae bacterium]|nr:TonB family protein [Opitutaceae bacterium]
MLTAGLSAAPTEPSADQRVVALGIAFDRGIPAKPEIDRPLGVRVAPPIELPANVAAAMSPKEWGRVRLRIEADGTVAHAKILKGRPGKELEALLEGTLKSWVFESPRHEGKELATTIHVVYAPLVGQASRGNDGDRAAQFSYLVPPSYPDCLRRSVATHNTPRRLGLGSQQVVVNRVVRDPSTGRIHSIPEMRTLVAAESLDYSEPESDARVAPFPGVVLLAFDLDERGVPHKFRVVGSTCSAFEPEAVAAANLWRYQPAMTAGVPVPTSVTEPVQFPAAGRVMPSFLRPAGDEAWDSPPKFRHLALPVHPRSSSSDLGGGTAEARVSLDAEGKILEVAPGKSTRPEFSGALRAALFASTFEPATRGAQPVVSSFSVTARFDKGPANESLDETSLPSLRLAAAAGIVTIQAKELDRPPRRLSGRQPAFRVADLEGAPSGSTTVEFAIDHHGRVCEPIVIQSTHRALGYAAVQAVASWCFDPPTRAGTPVATRVRIPFRFEPGAAAVQP